MSAKTLPDRIADTLRREILRGTLAPGHPIKERDHATAMNVSRTPMREAIRILAKEGLVDLRPSRSPLVADPDFDDICGTIELLMAIEEFAAEMACQRAEASELDEIRSLHQEMLNGAAELDMLDFFELDMRFHRAIVAAAHNAALAEEHLTHLQRMWRVRYLSARRRDSSGMAQHEEILRGLETKDPVLVRTTLRDHLSALLANIREDYAAASPPDPEADAKTAS